MFPLRPLRSTVITRFLATTGRPDSRRGRLVRLCLPPRRWDLLWLSHPAGSPRFLDRSVHARCPLPPRKARRLLAPVTSPPVSGFTFFGRLAAFTFPNEAELGSLALRLACLPHEASLGRLLGSAPVWLPVERVILRVTASQITRSARLILAHRSGRQKTPRDLCRPLRGLVPPAANLSHPAGRDRGLPDCRPLRGLPASRS